MGNDKQPLADGYQIRKREDWSRLFQRDEGWTGSDNTYSIPLPGGQTFFTFGDSFIGTVDPLTGARSPDSIMVNNAAGILEDGVLSFHFGPAKPGLIATSLFVPPMPDLDERSVVTDDVALTSDHIRSPNDPNYYWPQDGLVEAGHLWIFAIRVAPDPSGPEGFRFKVLGTDLLSVRLADDGLPDFGTLKVTPFPFHHQSHFSIYFGTAVLAEEGSPWVYVYGLRQEAGANLVLARYPVGKISDFEAWCFFDGCDWVDDFMETAVLASGISSECSVNRLEFGKRSGSFALIYNRNGVDPFVEMKLGAAPEGPFTETVHLYDCPEVDDDRGIYCYNAKAHPELSRSGSLLISYNVNTRKDYWNMADGRIYRTRWIELLSDDLHLHPLLKDGAVLQRERALALSGWAVPGEAVSLHYLGVIYSAVAGDDGVFVIDLPEQVAGGPHRLRFTTATAEVALEDVYFGDVYLAGGQSNMQMSFAESIHADEDRAAFGDPLLRVNLVPQRSSGRDEMAPWEWTSGPWAVLAGDVLDGFSAVAAYAGFRLRELDPAVPIGLVGCYMGGTSATCWTSAATLAGIPELGVYEEEFRERIRPWLDPAVYTAETEAYQTRFAEWLRLTTEHREAHPDAVETELTALFGPAPWPPPENETSFMRPSGLYENMLAPLRYARFKAAMFYQGESDTSHPELYERLFAAMLGDWRALFGDLSLVQVQLPVYDPTPVPGLEHHVWGLLRGAQRAASRAADVCHVVALDQGDIEDLHPRQKRILGLRLGQLLASGQAVDAYVDSVVRDGREIRLAVRLAEGAELVYEPDAVWSGFELVLVSGQRLAVDAGSVRVDGDALVVRLADDVDMAAALSLAYGMRNDAVATVAVRCDGLKSRLAEIDGALEAFCVEL